MWFRNLQLFRLAAEWAYDTEALAAALAGAVFQGCGATDRSARGWVPPRGEENELVFAAGRQQLIALGHEQKLLPAAVVRQYARAKIEAQEQAQARKLGRKEVRQILEDVELEMLPRAFGKRALTYVWIDPVGRWLVVDAASSARADEVIEHLKLSLNALPLALLKTCLAPGTAMTQWLAGAEAPVGFDIDRDCELRSPSEERPAVRYVRHNLDSDEVRGHIGAGKAATRLALTWEGRLSFVLTEQLQIKRLAFLDVVKESAEREAENAADLFAANFALMAGELGRFLPDLVRALGGEAE